MHPVSTVRAGQCMWLQVLKSEGPLALTTGLGPTLYRNCIWNSLYYGTMHEVRAGHVIQPTEHGGERLARVAGSAVLYALNHTLSKLEHLPGPPLLTATISTSTVTHVSPACPACVQLETHHLKPLGNGWLEAARSFGVGLAVGMGATCFNAPFDVVKSRFQVRGRRMMSEQSVSV
jgi:hypothetical protein